MSVLSAKGGIIIDADLGLRQGRYLPSFIDPTPPGPGKPYRDVRFLPAKGLN